MPRLWTVRHPSSTTLREVNALNEAIAERVRAGGEREPPCLPTRTRFASPGCDGIVGPLLEELRVGAGEWPAEELVVLRSTILDPYFMAGPPMPDHLHGLVWAVREVAEAEYPRPWR